MKIAIIGPAYPYRGGIAAYDDRMALEFKKNGHDVTIYTFTMQYPGFLFPGKTQFLTGGKAPDVKIVRCINSINPFNWLKVGNRIKKEKPDLLISRFWLPFMGPSFGTIMRRVKKNGHTKILAFVDNMVPHESRIGDKTLTKYFIKPVDGYVAMADSVLKDIESFDQEKPKIITPHPMFDHYGDSISRDEALDILNLDKANRYILFFGFIRKYKGLDLLLKAFANQEFRDTNIKLIVENQKHVPSVTPTVHIPHAALAVTAITTAGKKNEVDESGTRHIVEEDASAGGDVKRGSYSEFVDVVVQEMLLRLREGGVVEWRRRILEFRIGWIGNGVVQNVQAPHRTASGEGEQRLMLLSWSQIGPCENARATGAVDVTRLAVRPRRIWHTC